MLAVKHIKEMKLDFHDGGFYKTKYGLSCLMWAWDKCEFNYGWMV